MHIEHRASMRRRIAVGIVINHGIRPPRLCRTRDLSTAGAFVELGPADLRLRAAVEAIMNLEYHHELAPHHLAAEVVRVTRDGIALHFRDYDDTTYTALVSLLYAAP